MDPAPAAESDELANACEKRAAAVEEDGDVAALRKRMKNGGANEAEMRRIAEIVLVLSAMGAMRGGRNPTEPEKAMMAEARAMAVTICEDLAPKDIVPKEAFGAIIEDLGLNRLKEQRLGFRPPKLSIVEKMESSKRKMGELQAFAAQAAVDSAQRAEAGIENHGTPTAVHPFFSDKASYMQASPGTFHHISSTGLVSAASSTTLYFQPATTQVTAPVVSTGLSNSNLGRDSSIGGRVNGLSQAPHAPTGFTVKTTAALQPRSIPTSNMSTNTKPPQHTPVTVEGSSNLRVPPLNSQLTSVQRLGSVFTQAVPGTLPSLYHPIQGKQFINASQHLEVSKIVQKQLHPKPAESPTWSPPSKDYMSKSVICQMCKLAIKEVGNMFVCDACEKGFHSKCLQPTNQKFVPRGEWYCPRCTSISSGKPFPPKYGRVTRNLVTTNITSGSGGLQSLPEKRVESQVQNACQQKIVAELEPNVRIGLQGGLVDVSPEPKTVQTIKTHGSALSATIKKEEISTSETSPDKNPAPTGASSVTSYAGPLEIGPAQHALRTDNVKAEASDVTSASSSGFDASKDFHPSNSHSIAHGSEAFSAGVSSEDNKDSSQMGNHSEKSSGKKTDDCNPRCNFKQGDADAGQKKQIGTAGASTDFLNTAKDSEGMHHVYWIGDVHESMQDKKFYQCCQINGVVYRLQDFALIQSSNGRQIPWKLQAMWEDSQTGSRWVAANRCYFPVDLPATVGHPSAPDRNEVYESNDESTLKAGLIEGPCVILPAKKFGETDQVSDQQSNGGPHVFSCRWFYDKIKGVFRPIPC